MNARKKEEPDNHRTFSASSAEAKSPMAPLLDMRGITKAFTGVRALTGVDLAVRAGEVHALVGENGAGKSTLMKILAGVLSKDEGEVLLEGRPIQPQTPAEAQALGISLVHQELSLAPNLTVAENIFVRHEPCRFGLLQWNRLNRRAQELLDEFDLHIAPDTLVKRLGLGARQVVEIAKALAIEVKLLAFDEPTSSLETHEVELLFQLIGGLKNRGLGIIYISHKMDEIFRIADRITVLRDGQYVGTRTREETSPAEIVRMMVGRVLDHLYPPKASQVGDWVFELRGLTALPKLDGVNLGVRRGEILGLAGLIGSGRTEAMLAAVGAASRDGGEIWLDGHPIRVESPQEARAHGIVYSPEDRKEKGLFLAQDVRANIVAAALAACSHHGLMDRVAENTLSRALVGDLAIKTPDLESPVSTLSGGNQQKVLLAKWLATEPRVLIVDEPTRGVDVGSKSEIHHLLRRFTENGGAVIMISSELPEILGMSDRIAVFREGRVAGELDGQTATEEAIMRLAIRSEARP